MPASPVKKRGQPPKDIAWRLRNWLWYWKVKQVTGKSDERLDSDYLPNASAAGVRPRLFQRVRSLGSDPCSPRKELDGESVFDRVHGGDCDPALDVARDAFRSELWVMLSDPRRDLEHHRRFIEGMIERQGWYRANPRDRKLATVFFRDDPAFGQGSDREHVYSAMLTYFESNPTADHVAMLGALFREALSEVELEKAIQLRSALRGCTAMWLHGIDELPYDVSELVQNLVEERLVRNNWHVPALDHAIPNQRQYVHALVREHLKHAKDAPPQSAWYPIVLPSPRVQWLHAHQEALEKAAEFIGQAQQNVFNYVGGQVFVEDGVFERAEWEELMQSRGEQAQAWREYEKSLRDAIQPPPRDTRFCLPVLPREGVRQLSRAKPYLIDGSLEMK